MARFLDNLLARSPPYQDIISRIQKGETFLDVGCFLGQELRQLVLDLNGFPTNNLYAVDIVNHWDLGYEFFRDADRFNVEFIKEDIVHPGKRLSALQGEIDIILVNQVFHQWGLDVQTEAAIELVKLSRAKPGSLILGYQAGVLEQRELVGPKGSKYRSLLHTEDTWMELWQEVGKKTGSEWKSESKLLTWEELGHNPEETVYMGSDVLMQEFVLTRVN